MFFVFKLNKYKILMGLTILIILILLFFLGYKTTHKKAPNLEVPVTTVQQTDYKFVEDFIKNYGWQIDKNSLEVEEFYLPSQFDTIYKRYNQYQMDVGLDLKDYMGKKIKRFTYKVTNYKDSKYQVYADVLTYDSKVIGGDLKTNNVNGFMVSMKNKTFKDITGIDEWMYR